MRKVAGLLDSHSHMLGQSWIGHFISSKCASIFAQNAPNVSIYSSIRRECFRTDLRGSGVATGQRKFLSPSGRESTETKHRCGDCCIRFIRISGMTHVRTSPNYPQSNGKLERWHKSLKSECIRPGTPLSLEDAKRLIQQYVDRYNYLRLHSAIGYVTPKDMLAGHQQEIQAERDRKLDAAKEQRKNRRQRAA